MPDSYDVVVAGSGMGGLTAAALSAARGLRTLMLERQDSVGGYMSSFRRGPYRFDSGASFLGAIEDGGEMAQLLEAAGVRDRVRFVPVGNSFRVCVPGRQVDFDMQSASFVEALAARFPDYRRPLARLSRVVEKTGREIERFAALDGWRRIFAPVLCPRLFRYARATLGGLIYPQIDDPILRALMTNLPATAPPSEIAFLFAATVLTKCNAGDLYHPVGGFGQFAGVLAEAIESKGGRVRTGDGLAAIEHDGRRVRAVRTDSGERIETRAVAAGFNPDDALAILDGPQTDAIGSARERAARVRYSGSAFVVYLGLRPDVDWSREAFLTTIIEDIDLERVYSAVARGEIPEQTVIHAFFPCAAETRAGVDEPPVAKIFIPAGYDAFARLRSEKGEEAYRAYKNTLADSLIERTARQIRSLSDSIVLHEIATPLTFERWTGNRRGAIYGIEPVPDQFGPWRWPNAGVLKGLYFCGHYTRPSHGVVGACFSGRFAANCISYDLKKGERGKAKG